MTMKTCSVGSVGKKKETGWKYLDSVKLVTNAEASVIMQENVLQKGKAKVKSEAKVKKSAERVGPKEKEREMKKDSRAKEKEKGSKIKVQERAKDHSTEVASHVEEHTLVETVRKGQRQQEQSEVFPVFEK